MDAETSRRLLAITSNPCDSSADVPAKGQPPIVCDENQSAAGARGSQAYEGRREAG